MRMLATKSSVAFGLFRYKKILFDIGNNTVQTSVNATVLALEQLLANRGEVKEKLKGVYRRLPYYPRYN